MINRSIRASVGIATLLWVAVAISAYAAKSTETPEPEHPIAPPVTVPVAKPKVGNATPSVIKAGDTFLLPIDSQCLQTAPLSSIDLLIQGGSSGLHPIRFTKSTSTLAFVLTRDPSSANSVEVDNTWALLLGRPWTAGRSGFIRKLNYSLVSEHCSDGVEDGQLNVAVLDGETVLIGGSLVLLVWGALFWLGKSSGLIRDAGNAGTSVKDRPYSLARTQIAWWFAIIVAAYLFLWVATGSIPDISAQALGLMGVSGATGLASAGLDANKNAPPTLASGKFFDDLLTDADGVTIYRFQMLSMTIILGIIFLMRVATRLSMPDFDGNTLAMLGLSAGTYVGFKVPESHTSDSSGPTPPQPADDEDSAKAGYTPAPEPP